VNSKAEIIADENAVCEHCGQSGAQEIGRHLLCADCVTQAGCNCAGGDSED
jgi:hypothetical protein